MRALVALPHLHTLRLTHLPDAPLWSPLLPSAPSLTSIDIEQSFGYDEEVMRDVTKCASLKELTLRAPSLYGQRFLAFFTSPSMRSLESLALHRFFCGPVPFADHTAVTPADYAAAFTSLHSLHSLTFTRCFDIDLLLPHLAAAPSLRQLIVEAHVPGFDLVDNSAMPSAPVLTQLLMAAPSSLHCTLALEPVPYWSEPVGDAAAPKSRVDIELDFAPLQAAVGARFSLLFRH